MIELTLDMAERAAQVALAKAKTLGTAMTASVVDEAGRTVLVMPSIGGVPITKNGRVIGAIGCGGGTGEHDRECALAVAAAVAGYRRITMLY